MHQCHVRRVKVVMSLILIFTTILPPVDCSRSNRKAMRGRRLASSSSSSRKDWHLLSVDTGQKLDETLGRMPTKSRRVKREAPANPNENEDTFKPVDYTSGEIGDSEMFDMRSQHTMICTLCLWIQPNFAQHFKLDGNLTTGVSQIVDVVNFLSWIFRAMDLNMDRIPDPIALHLEQIYLGDISLPLSTSKDKGSAREGPITFSKNTGSIGEPSKALESLHASLPEKFGEDKACCAILSFVYFEVPKLLSFSSLRGLCSSRNIGVVSGLRKGVKLASFDLFRATFHAMGHLLGSTHDSPEEDCPDSKSYGFHNYFVMDKNHYGVNMGIRANSMRMSFCSKSMVAMFLTSPLQTCLKPKEEKFCGNGIIEEGEECDCGAPWQCVQGDQCCGIRDGLSPCKTSKTKRLEKCKRPTEW